MIDCLKFPGSAPRAPNTNWGASNVSQQAHLSPQIVPDDERDVEPHIRPMLVQPPLIVPLVLVNRVVEGRVE